jgi:hypothetical protein
MGQETTKQAEDAVHAIDAQRETPRPVARPDRSSPAQPAWGGGRAPGAPFRGLTAREPHAVHRPPA